uniref:Uncharacterized protein n=1 Tax=Panagrolaimus sp. JU765 TaxID=591449 RepID=A0AC34Q290_9BILA
MNLVNNFQKLFQSFVLPFGLSTLVISTILLMVVHGLKVLFIISKLLLLLPLLQFLKVYLLLSPLVLRWELVVWPRKTQLFVHCHLWKLWVVLPLFVPTKLVH